MEIEQINSLLTTYTAETDLLKKIHLGTQISDDFLTHKKYEEALRYLLDILKIAQNIQNDFEIATIYNRLGEVYRRTKDYDRAERALLKAVLVFESLHDEAQLPRPYINLGASYSDKSNHFQALEYFEKALVLSEKLKDQRLIGMAFSSVGRTYLEISEFQKAIQYLRQSLKILPPDSEQILVNCVNLGISYGYLGDYSLAIGYFKRVIPSLHATNHQVGIAELYCRISDCYIHEGLYDKAMDYAHRAQDYVGQNQIGDAYIESFICKLFLQLHQANGNIAETEHCIQRFSELQVTNQGFIRDFYKIASYFYEKQQKYDLALQYIKKYYDINKTILDNEMQKNIAIKTANFEYEREKQRADLLKQQNIELQMYQKIIEKKNEELVTLQDSKDNVVNTISHDFKNYLGAAEQALEILTLKEKTLVDNKYLKIVTNSITRSLSLIQEVLYSIKTTAMKNNLVLQTLDINKVIAENEEPLRLRGDTKGIDIIFEYAPQPLFVQIDSEKWHRIFENLTTNAIKFSFPDSEIHITTRREGDFALISIADSGVGIPPESIGKLFLPFSGVGRKGTGGEESTGLGLSIVKKLVDLHGGSIDVHSEVGHGTEFTVKLNIVSPTSS